MDTFEISKDASEMNEGELRATLLDLVAKHNEQVDEADDYSEKVADLEATVDEYEADVNAATAFFSELLGSEKDMDPEVLAEKFTAVEMREQINMDAFSLESDDSEEDKTTFDDNPEQSDSHPGEEDDLAEYRDDARDALTRLGIASYDD